MQPTVKYVTSRFQPASSYVVSAEPLMDRLRLLLCKPTQMPVNAATKRLLTTHSNQIWCSCKYFRFSEIHFGGLRHVECFDITTWSVALYTSHYVSEAYGLGQTGHPEGATDHHRRPCILCRRSSRLEQFVVIDAECTFVACF